MKLSEIKFKTSYNSYDNDIINEFYIRTLSNSISYDRVSAYFDSKILALYSIGLEKIFNNHGKIRFIFSQQLTEKDYQLMLDGYNNRVNEILLNNYRNSDITAEDKLRLSNLAFLIERNIVDIKIAFTKSGILHDKFGLISDESDNTIYFRGSNNETVAAIESNHESFEVSCSWNEEKLENEKIEEAKKNFNKMWNDSTYGMRVIEIPEIIKKEIMKFYNGNIMLDCEINYYNSLVADMDDSNKLIVRNELLSNIDFDKDYDYKNYIKKYVESINKKIMYFSDNMNYIDMEKVIKRFEKSSEYNNYNFIVSSKLRNYIKSNNLEIEKRKELGKLIKRKDSVVYQKFLEFNTVVNSEMERKLRDKQMWDAFFITKMIKSANYSVPGAGKTSIVYGAFSYLNSKEINEVDKLIVIGPKNSFKSWKDEFYACFGDNKKLNLLNIQSDKYRNSSERISTLRFESNNNNLILINYDLLYTLQDVLKEIIDDRTFLIFDEVHKVKSVTGVWSSSALNVSKNAKYKVILTGTPIPNSYVDLYTQLNILFTNEYNTFFKFTPKELNKKDDNISQKINDSIYPFFCRTTKKDLNIPMPNIDKKIFVPMNSKEQELFSIIRRKYAKNGLALYIRLMQASTNPKLLLNKLNYGDLTSLLGNEEDENDDNLIYSDEHINKNSDFSVNEKTLIASMDMTSKFWNGIELIEKLVKEKKQVLVWGIFINTIEKINEELTKRGIKSKVIYGATDLKDREKIIDEFKNNEFNVLITNPHTLAESVSLHKTCHDAIYFEYSFNLTHMLQSRDRINRLGLNDNQYTQYYYLILRNDIFDEDSIDLKTYDRLKEKEDLMIKSIEGELIESINFDMLDDIKIILNQN